MGASHSHALVLRDTRNSVDSLDRVVGVLAERAELGFHTTNLRIDDTQEFVSQMELATGQGFAYCNNKISRLEVLMAVIFTIQICMTFRSPQRLSAITDKACAV